LVTLSRHQQSEHLVGADRAHRQRGADRTVDAARQCDDQAAAPQLAAQQRAHALGDAGDFGVVVECQQGRQQVVDGLGHCASSADLNWAWFSTNT
jgi:hypothetical protein